MTEPTAQTGPGQEQINVTIHWPSDTYQDAKPANTFVFTDNGDSVCIAFGFMPPPPNVQELAAASKDNHLHFTIDQRESFVISRKMLVQMQQELTQFISMNTHLFRGIV